MESGSMSRFIFPGTVTGIPLVVQELFRGVDIGKQTGRVLDRVKKEEIVYKEEHGNFTKSAALLVVRSGDHGFTTKALHLQQT